MKQWRSDSLKLGTRSIHVVMKQQAVPANEYQTEAMEPFPDYRLAEVPTRAILPAVKVPKRPMPQRDTPKPRLRRIELEPIPPRVVERGDKGVITVAVISSVLPTTALIQREVRYFLGLAGRLPRKITLSKARRKEIGTNHCHVRVEGGEVEIPYETIQDDVVYEVYLVG